LPNPSKHNTAALAALLLLALIWGYNWVVMKLALDDIGAFQFGAVRTFFGALVLFAVIAVLRRPLRPAQLPMTLLLGLLQTSGFTGLIIWALVEGGAGKTAVLSFTMPFWVMLLAWPMLGEKLRGLQWLAAAFSVSGLACILEPWAMHGKMFSNFLALFAGVCWALSVILAKKLHQRAPDLDLLSFTAWQMLFGSVPLVAVAFLLPAKPIEWSNYLIGASLFNIFLANGLGWWLWLYALQRLPAGVASMNSLLIPVVAVLAAWLQLDEIPSTTEAIGMAMIGTALALIAARGMRRHEAVEPAMGQD
jgi:drug/metabolite transporter (DMT)-like permease